MWIKGEGEENSYYSEDNYHTSLAITQPRARARVGLELGVWPRWCRLYLWSIPHLCVIDSKLWLPG